MKKLFRLNTYGYFGNSGWVPVRRGATGIQYLDVKNAPVEVNAVEFKDFDEAYKWLMVPGNELLTAYPSVTFLGAPRIDYYYDFPSGKKTISRRNFQPFGEKEVWEEDTEPHTMYELVEEMTTDDFLAYCADIKQRMKEEGQGDEG